jgi:hypothetical protein
MRRTDLLLALKTAQRSGSSLELICQEYPRLTTECQLSIRTSPIRIRWAYILFNSPSVPTLAKETPLPTLAKETPLPTLAKEKPLPTLAKETPLPTLAKETPLLTSFLGSTAWEITLQYCLSSTSQSTVNCFFPPYHQIVRRQPQPAPFIPVTALQKYQRMRATCDKETERRIQQYQYGERDVHTREHHVFVDQNIFDCDLTISFRVSCTCC